MAQYSTIRQYIQLIQKLSQVADQGERQARDLEAAYDQLNRQFSVQRNLQGGLTGVIRQQDIQRVNDLLAAIQKLGPGFSAAVKEAQKLQQAMLKGTQLRMPSGTYESVSQVSLVPIDKIEQRIAKVSGSTQQFINTLQSADAAFVLPETFQTALRDIESRYKGIDVELQNVRGKLDATNQEWSVQADVVKKVGKQLQFIKEESARVEALTGKVKEQTRAQEILSQKLGPRRLSEFNNKLKGMGLSMSDLTSVSTDAANGVSAFNFRTQEAGNVTTQATFRIDRFGRVLQDTSTRFRSFDDMIARNIGKVAEWGIAVGIVFGAWRQAQQMVTTMIDLQDRMADIAIITGEATNEMNAFFDSVANIAAETGTDVSQAMDAMREALQAGGGATAASRRQVGFQILEDAAVLAKLSGIEINDAVDIITSSLRQMQHSLEGAEEPLLRGPELLNRWVAVSREAQVSLKAMGKGFATVSASASIAGVDVDELTAYIATMSEVTNLSAQQSANALRAMFSSVQNPSAQRVLNQYGIAVENVNGELRDMPDILDDIFTSMETGLISESALTEIGRALGGQGARRQTQMIAFLNSYARAMELTTVSANAQGDAEEALGTKMDTLRNSVIELKNAFSILAQTLGGEGGLLSAMTLLVDAGTGMVNLLNSLTKAAGPATAALAGLAAVWGIGRYKQLPERLGMGSLRYREALPVGMKAGPRGGQLPYAKQAFDYKGKQYKAGQYVSRDLMGANAHAWKVHTLKAAPAIGISIATNMITALTGQQEWDTASGRMAGSVVGGMVGALAGPAGAMIGTFIGDAIGGGIVNSIKQSRELQQTLQIEVDEEASKEQLQQVIDTLQADIEKTTGLGGGVFGTLGKAAAINMAWLWETESPLFSGEQNKLQNWAEAFGLAEPKLIRLRKEIEKLEEAQQELTRREHGKTLLDFGFGSLAETKQRYAEYANSFGSGLEAAFEERRMQLPLEFVRGEIDSTRALSAELERLRTLPNQILPIWDAFTLSMRANGEVIDNQSEAFRDLGLELSQWEDANIQFVLEEALAIENLRQEVEKLQDQIEESVDPEFIEDASSKLAILESRLDSTVAGFAPLVQELIRTGAAMELSIPGFTDLKDMTQEEFQEILSSARELQDQLADELSIPDEAFDSIEAWAVFVDDTFQWVGKDAEGVMKSIFQLAQQMREETQSDQFNIRRLTDIDPSRFAEIQKANRYWVEMLARMQGMSSQQYMEQEGSQFNLLLGEQNVWKQIWSTNQAMLFTLQDIKETEEKQLEGMWNIPAGQTFWVPISSLFYQQQDGMQYPDLAPLIPPTERTAEHTGRSVTLNTEQRERLDRIIQELQRMGLSVSPAEDWSPEAALELLRQDEMRFIFDDIFPEGALPKLPDQYDQAMQEVSRRAIQTMQEQAREDWLPGYQPGQPMINESYEIQSGINRAFNELYLPSTMRDAVREGVSQGLYQDMPGFTMPGDITPEMAPQPIQIDVQPAEVQGEFTIHNTVMLDGAVIRNYVNRFLEQALSRTIGTSGRRLGGLRR